MRVDRASKERTARIDWSRRDLVSTNAICRIFRPCCCTSPHASHAVTTRCAIDARTGSGVSWRPNLTIFNFRTDTMNSSSSSSPSASSSFLPPNNPFSVLRANAGNWEESFVTWANSFPGRQPQAALMSAKSATSVSGSLTGFLCSWQVPRNFDSARKIVEGNWRYAEGATDCDERSERVTARCWARCWWESFGPCWPRSSSRCKSCFSGPTAFLLLSDLADWGFPTCDDAIMNKTNVPVHAKDGEVWEGVAQKNVF